MLVSKEMSIDDQSPCSDKDGELNEFCRSLCVPTCAVRASCNYCWNLLKASGDPASTSAVIVIEEFAACERLPRTLRKARTVTSLVGAAEQELQSDGALTCSTWACGCEIAFVTCAFDLDNLDALVSELDHGEGLTIVTFSPQQIAPRRSDKW